MSYPQVIKKVIGCPLNINDEIPLEQCEKCKWHNLVSYGGTVFCRGNDAKDIDSI